MTDYADFLKQLEDQVLQESASMSKAVVAAGSEFDESMHPREKDGKFALKGEGVAVGTGTGTTEGISKKSKFEEIFRGEGGTSKKGGMFWSPDSEFARQFTQSGQEKEIKKAYIKHEDILTMPELPYAGDPDEVDVAIKYARQKGFKAVRLSEGTGNAPSVFVFDQKALKSRSSAGAGGMLELQRTILASETKMESAAESFDEGEHPRDKDGKFTSKGEGVASGTGVEGAKPILFKVNSSLVDARYFGKDQIDVSKMEREEFRSFFNTHYGTVPISEGFGAVPVVYIRFGRPAPNMSPSFNYIDMKFEKGVSVFPAWYDKKTETYVVTSDTVGETFYYMESKPYLVEGEFTGKYGEDAEPLLDPTTFKIVKELSRDKIVHSDNPDIAISDRELNPDEVPDWERSEELIRGTSDRVYDRLILKKELDEDGVVAAGEEFDEEEHPRDEKGKFTFKKFKEGGEVKNDQTQTEKPSRKIFKESEFQTIQNSEPIQRAAEDSEYSRGNVKQPNGLMVHDPEKGHVYMYALGKQRGYTKTPEVRSKEEMDSFVAHGEREIFRGIGNDTDDKLFSQFKTGKTFYGVGQYGSGIYAGYDRNGKEIAAFYGGEEKRVMRMTIKPEAKIVHVDKLEQEIEEFEQKAPQKEVNALMDRGAFAISRGYDVILVSQPPFMNILNRGVVRVQNEKVKI